MTLICLRCFPCSSFSTFLWNISLKMSMMILICCFSFDMIPSFSSTIIFFLLSLQLFDNLNKLVLGFFLLHPFLAFHEILYHSASLCFHLSFFLFLWWNLFHLLVSFDFLIISQCLHFHLLVSILSFLLHLGMILCCYYPIFPKLWQMVIFTVCILFLPLCFHPVVQCLYLVIWMVSSYITSGLSWFSLVCD